MNVGRLLEHDERGATAGARGLPGLGTTTTRRELRCYHGVRYAGHAAASQDSGSRIEQFFFQSLRRSRETTALRVSHSYPVAHVLCDLSAYHRVAACTPWEGDRDK